MKTLIEELEKITDSRSLSNIDVSKIIIVRLIVERLGEIELNGWWQSRVLSDFGRSKLKEMIPKTHNLNRVKLAFEVASKKEMELIFDKDYISLFRLTPEAEKLIDSIIHAAKSDIDNILDKINTITAITDLRFENVQTEKINTQRELIGTPLGAYSLGELEETSLSQEKINQLIDALIYSWTKNKKGQLLIPYYKIKK